MNKTYDLQKKLYLETLLDNYHSKDNSDIHNENDNDNGDDYYSETILKPYSSTHLLLKKYVSETFYKTQLSPFKTKSKFNSSPERIYNPPYDLLIKIDNSNTNTNVNVSTLIENYINNVFNISKNYLKSNTDPDTIKAIISPYSNNLFQNGLCSASAYYQLYDRTKPIKNIILLCTNSTKSSTLISTSFTSIKSYKNETLVNNKPISNTSLKINTKIIDTLKPYLEINNELIENEVSLYSNLPFIETIAPGASIIPILISNSMYLDNNNNNKISNVINILKKYLKSDDTILISTSNFTDTSINNDINTNTNTNINTNINTNRNTNTNYNIKKEDNIILQFIYDNVDGYKTRSSKIDDILFIQNTPSTSSLSFYIFSNLLSNYTNTSRSSSSSSNSSNSNGDSGISIDFNTNYKNLYSRITSYYTSLNEKITSKTINNTINNTINDTINKNHINQFTPNDLFNNSSSTSPSLSLSPLLSSSEPSISYIGLLFTTQPYFENNKKRVIDNSFSEYEKHSLTYFMKQEFYLNTTSSILKNTVSNFNTIKNFNNTIHKINNLPINSPIFKKHLGIFITLYKKDTNELRGCIGTSETNNDDYTIETNIKKFVCELSTKTTKCRDLEFSPIHYNELDILTFELTILYHMKPINSEDYLNHFKFGSDGLLFKTMVNNKPLCKYSLTQMTLYFNRNNKEVSSNTNNNNNNNKILLNELSNTYLSNTNFILFYNEGMIIKSY